MTGDDAVLIVRLWREVGHVRGRVLVGEGDEAESVGVGVGVDELCTLICEAITRWANGVPSS